MNSRILKELFTVMNRLTEELYIIGNELLAEVPLKKSVS